MSINSHYIPSLKTLLPQGDTTSFALVTPQNTFLNLKNLGHIGDKVFVDPSSIVGSVGVVAFTTFAKKALEEHKIKVKNIVSRE